MITELSVQGFIYSRSIYSTSMKLYKNASSEEQGSKGKFVKIILLMKGKMPSFLQL